jgi:1-acyl-sn-glycerol-3-phosphate acyltransferase
MSDRPTQHSIPSGEHTSRLVQACRLARLCLHMVSGCLQVGIVFPFLPSRWRFLFIRRWSRQLLRILRVHYATRGELPAGSPTLIVSNHVSWLDIWIINSVVGVRFVAKSDIRRWPVIGFLVKGAGTIFIERDKRHDTARTNRYIVRALTRGEYVAIFPEGICTDGREVRPYHASLFQPAVGAGAKVAVLALRYVREDGELNDDASYAGERSLLQSTRLILRQRTAAGGSDLGRRSCGERQDAARDRGRSRACYRAGPDAGASAQEIWNIRRSSRRTAESARPHRHPVSRAITSGRNTRPRADQWPEMTQASRLTRPGTSNHGSMPAGADAGSPEKRRSIFPSTLHTRKRVIALTITRRRANPLSVGSQWSGSLPYILPAAFDNQAHAAPARLRLPA